MAQDQRPPAPEPDGTRHTAPDDRMARGSALAPGTGIMDARAAVAHNRAGSDGTRNLVPESRITWTGEAVREWVRAALVRAAAPGERFSYDASLTMVPVPARGTMTSAYVIVIYTPSARMDLEPFGTVRVTGDNPDEQTITDIVRDMVNDLRGKQTEALRAPVDLRGFRPS